MSLYIIEDDNCNVLTDYGDFDNTMIHAMLYDEPIVPESYVKEFGGHVVKLTEEPTPVVVSQEEAEMLEQAKDDYCAASVISAYSTDHIGAMGQDRLMRAYVIGWTVEKPKRYVLPMPSGNPDEKSMRFAKRLGPQNWQPSNYRHTVGEVSGLVSFLVTQSDINMAPDWVKAITPVEVTE